MEHELTSSEETKSNKFENLNTVTPFSKYLAMALFVALPFLGGWVGYTYAPEKVVEVEKIVEVELERDNHIDSTLIKLPGEPEENTYDFNEYLYSDGRRPFLFAEPSKASVVREHNQCEPFDGGLYKYEQDKMVYELVTSIYVDRENAPCKLSLGYLGVFGSKYYFAEPLGKQTLYVINISEDVPSLIPLDYTHLRVASYSDVGDRSSELMQPNNLILVRTSGKDALSVFDMESGTSRVIYDNPDYSYLDIGLGMFVYVTEFTREEITFSVMPLDEPDENGRRDPLTDQIEYVTVSLQ